MLRRLSKDERDRMRTSLQANIDARPGRDATRGLALFIYPLDHIAALDMVDDLETALRMALARDTGNESHDWTTCPEPSCVMGRRALGIEPRPS